jgi:hypothetical protein
MYSALPVEVFGKTTAVQRTVRRDFVILQNQYHEISANNGENKSQINSNIKNELTSVIN